MSVHAAANPTPVPTQVGKPLRIGVALCTYNGGAYIRAQLESILRQTRRVDTLVVSDDGSRDDTCTQVEQTLHAAPLHWQLLRDGRLGVTRNFARAVQACDADLILLCDQDDVWRDDKVAHLAAVFEHDPAALLAFSNAELVDAQLQPLGRTQFQHVRMTPALRQALAGPRAFEALLRRNVVTGATVAFHRRLLDLALPFAESWLHDEWLAILAAAGGGLRPVDDTLVSYRQHGRNQCGMRPEPLAQQLAAAAAATAGRDTDIRTRKLQALAQRMQGLPGERAAQQRQWLAEAQRFQARRAALPHARWQRALPVALQWVSGQYGRFADGTRSAAKDLLAAGRPTP